MSGGIFNHARKLRDFILDILFEKLCYGCGKDGQWLCEKCLKKIDYFREKTCLFCKTANKKGSPCSACREKTFINHIYIAGNYENKMLKNLIRDYKYTFNTDLKLPLVLFLIQYINKYKIPIRDFKLVPIPLSKKRRRWRGFNQSYELSIQLIKELNLSKINNCLLRQKHKTPQAKLSEEERRENVKEIFKISNKSIVPKNILLIDDVATTGSTLNEAARVLKNAGAKHVSGLVIAKG
ncbi:ComF family protein [bacterium]|nr:ComF family protein [bacterium]